MLYWSYTRTHFHLVYGIFAKVMVCHFLCSMMMVFDCQEIKGLLTYLIT